jgi:glycosyltransferase involved in cell wall biosynthesis
LNQPFLSVIVPIQPQDLHYSLLLNSLEGSSFKNFEVILVFDGWLPIFKESDYKLTIVRVENPIQSGPAYCRNKGASKAQGKYLCFCDSDTEHQKNTLALAVSYLENPDLDGLIGCYDNAPSCSTSLSKFRNLLHAYHHQKNNNKRGVFWGAFGVLKSEAFEAVGGFNAEKYSRPSIEDIELGYRLEAAGYCIRIKADVKLKHHKCWTISSMFRTDLFLRAIPWTQLLDQTKNWSTADLNVSWKEKMSAIAAALLLLNFAFLLVFQEAIFLLSFFALLLWQTIMQKNTYKFIVKQMGLKAILFVFLAHQFYLLIAIAGFISARLKRVI